MGCLDDNTIALLADGVLDAAERERADAHIDGCSKCRDLLVGLVGDRTSRRNEHELAIDGDAPTAPTIPLGAAKSAAPLERTPQATGAVWRAGDRVGHYRVLRYLGRGGVGEVYLARDGRLGRKVALKTLRSVLLRSKAAAARFVAEARTTAKLSHPNIVTIYAVAEHEGTPFLALEYVRGQSLHERMRERPLSVQEAARIAIAVAEALVHAHRHGVLHRDLKPGNVLIDTEGRVRVVDFGLAEIVEVEDPPTEDEIPPSTTPAPLEVSSREGTPLYMAPEQWRGHASSPATDIWALGVMLHMLVTRRHPFPTTSLERLGRAVCEESPEQPDAGFGLAPEIGELVARCLHKDADRRPAATDVLDALRALLSAPRHEAMAEDSPFRGLRTFRERDAGVFFGREAEIAAFVERLRTHPVLPVVGPSGSGKSSFIDAGVVPRLKEQQAWLVVRARPRNDPFAALATALLRVDVGSTSGAGELAHDSASSEARRLLAERLRDEPGELSVELRALARSHRMNVLLFVDQLEEIFTLVTDGEVRARFVRAVCAAADDDSDPIRIVFTMRDDFLVRLAQFEEGRSVLAPLMLLPAPSESALKEIIEGPVLVSGYGFDDARLVADMIKAVRGERACLPLLEFAALQLWERRDQQRRLLLRSAYDELGGVAGALARHADGVIDGLSTHDLRTTRLLLLRLVTPDRTRRVIRMHEALDGLGEGAGVVLERLTESRLLSVTRSRGQATGDALIELVHESLISGWTTLSRWIDESHGELVFLEELKEEAELWERRGRSPAALPSGDALQQALVRLARVTSPVPAIVDSFVREAETRRRRRRLRVRASVAALVAVLSCAALGASWVALYVDEQRGRAEEHNAQSLLEGARAAHAQGAVLEARAKLRVALEIQDSVGARALWWQLQDDPLVWRKDIGASVFGVDIDPAGRLVAGASQNGSIYLIDRETRVTRVLRGHDDQVIGIAFSPDGERLASGSLDGRACIWNVSKASVERVLEGPKSGVHGVTFGGDGKLLAAGGYDHTVRVWDVASGRSIHVLAGHEGVVRGVAFSPDGRWLASAGADRVVRLWKLDDGTQHGVLRGHEGEVYGVAFSPDGSLLASSSFDRTVRLWRIPSRQPIRALHGHEGSATSVRFSADGNRVVAGGADGTVRLWDRESGKPVGVVRESSEVWGLAASRDGNLLATGTASSGVSLWDLRTPMPSPDEQVHGDPLLAVDVDPEGKRLATAGNDSNIRVWSADSGRQERLFRLEGSARAVCFNPAKNQLAAAGLGRTIHLWDLHTGTELAVLRGHASDIYGLRFSPDGSRIGSASFDREARIWDAESGRVLHVLGGHGDRVRAVTFSSDGARIATASDDGVVRLWDADTGRLDRELRGHEGRVYDVRFSPDGRWVVSAGYDGAVRLWATDGHGEGADHGVGDKGASDGDHVLGRHDGRVYSVSFHPDGERVVSASADRTVRIWQVATKEHVVLRGHRNEVNAVELSRDGTLLASVSDDGTARLWRLAPPRAAWFGAGFLGSPPSFLSHAGWQALGGSNHDSDVVASTLGADAARWRSFAQTSARFASRSRRDEHMCFHTHDGMLALWDLASDQLVLSRPAADLEQLLAVDGGCLVLSAGRAVLHGRSGAEAVLETPSVATAIGGGQARMLVASSQGIDAFGESGKSDAHYAATAGVTALAEQGPTLVVGYRDGNIELLSTAPGAEGSAPLRPFEHVPASEVVSILLGPEGTIIAGYANGSLGMWDASDGTRLAMAQLHGPVSHLMLYDHALHAATELGRTTSWNLESFYQDRCAVLSEIWRLVPVVWQEGRAHLLAPPESHACAR